MKRLDLDDLPPKIAALLAGVEAGEALLLVRNGVVVARLIGEAAPAPAGTEAPAQTSEEQAKEIFEQFRSIMEDEF